MSTKQKGLFFPTMYMPGPEQMAMDVMILEKVIASSNISLALRFYNWEGLWLSIGKNHKNLPKDWIELIKERKISIVRRPSGGSAVLHGRGLTYCLIWLSPPRKKHEAYYLASQWLIKGFSDLGLPLKFGEQVVNPSSENCFSTSTAADLIDPKGCKRIGSAQLWRKGHLLQHGEILLDPPPKLWLDVFKTKAPKPASPCIPRQGLDQKLKKACATYWPQLNWQNAKVTQDELKQVSTKTKQYFFHPN